MLLSKEHWSLSEYAFSILELYKGIAKRKEHELIKQLHNLDEKS